VKLLVSPTVETLGFSRRVKPKALLLVLTLRVTPTATRLALAKG